MRQTLKGTEMKKPALLTALILALGVVAVLSFIRPQEAEAGLKSISGTVTYRERIALPPKAKVEVKLVDISLMDAPSKTIAETTIEPKGQVPIPFTLSYDPALIEPNNTYALQARITVDGQLMFITDQVYMVLTKGDGVTDLLLKRVGTSSPPDIAGTWLAEDIGGAGVIDNLQSTLQLSEDGSVSGTGGCNNFAGKAILAGDAISFGPLAATRMACVPAVNDQEAKFFDALSKTQSWRIDATGKLELFDSAGTRLALMARQ